MKKLRLLLTEVCNRRCAGCCNKDWGLETLPVCESYEGFSEFLLTGGEPLLVYELVRDTVAKIREQSRSPIYLYTGMSKDFMLFEMVLNIVDGITLTLHTKRDVSSFIGLNLAIKDCCAGKIMRLNVFDGIDLTGIDLSLWKVKDHIHWIKDCPLPEGEVFMRIAM
jgi:hypothetical protein